MAAIEVLPDTEDPDTAGFWAATREGRLVVQKCTRCAALRHPPHPYCPECQCATHEWQEVSGYGRVWTYAVVYKPTLPAFERFTPFPAGYVALEDHPQIRMAGNFVSVPGAAVNSVPQDRIKIGMRVKAVFDEVAADVTLPRWMPVDEGER